MVIAQYSGLPLAGGSMVESPENVIRSSSMVEHRPVKAIVAGSSPASGAKEKESGLVLGSFSLALWEPESRTGGSV